MYLQLISTCLSLCLVLENAVVVFFFYKRINLSISEFLAGEQHSAKKTTNPEARTPVQKELAELVNEFSGNTTLHGFGGLFKKRKTPNPLKWKNVMFLFALLACLTYLGINLNALVRDYLQYPVTTSIVRERREVMELPAITLCIPQTSSVSYKLYISYSHFKKNLSNNWTFILFIVIA